MNYSFLKGIKKGVVSAIIFAVPLILLNNPDWANLTIGGVLVVAVNFLKVKYIK